MGQLVKGGLLKPLDAYADAYGWNDRWSKTLLDLNRFSADGKQFGAGNLYGVSQQGEIVGVFYNKRHGRHRAEDVRRVRVDARARPRRRARPRSRSATSTSSAASTSSRPSRTSSPARTRRATSCSPRRRDVRHVGEPGGRDEAPGVGEEGLLHEGLQRHRLRPGVAAVHQGQGPVHDRRHLDHLRRVQGARRQARLLPDAGPRGGRDPVSLGGESLPWAITSKSKNADVAAAYIDFITNAQAGRRAGRDRQPAGHAGERAAVGAGAARTSSPPGSSSTTPTA